MITFLSPFWTAQLVEPSSWNGSEGGGMEWSGHTYWLTHIGMVSSVNQN